MRNLRECSDSGDLHDIRFRNGRMLSPKSPSAWRRCAYDTLRVAGSGSCTNRTPAWQGLNHLPVTSRTGWASGAAGVHPPSNCSLVPNRETIHPYVEPSRRQSPLPMVCTVPLNVHTLPRGGAPHSVTAKYEGTPSYRGSPRTWGSALKHHSRQLHPEGRSSAGKRPTRARRFRLCELVSLSFALSPSLRYIESASAIDKGFFRPTRSQCSKPFGVGPDTIAYDGDSFVCMRTTRNSVRRLGIGRAGGGCFKAAGVS